MSSAVDTSRRAVLKAGAATALANALAFNCANPSAAASSVLSGTVYENRSGSPKRQPSDPGISGVLVSNGCDVVKTDARGNLVYPLTTRVLSS